MTAQLVDLSLINRDKAYGVQISPKTTMENEGYRTTTLHLYSHAGTHLDAPSHYVPDGTTLDDLDLKKCIGRAHIIDLTPVQAETMITSDILIPFIEKIHPGTRILLRTDWDLNANRLDYRTRFPGLTLEAAQWLVGHGIILLGIDTPSVTPLHDRSRLKAVHQTFLKAGVVIIECLANLRALHDSEVYFIGLPIRIEHGDGSPVRAVAIEGQLEE